MNSAFPHPSNDAMHAIGTETPPEHGPDPKFLTLSTRKNSAQAANDVAHELTAALSDAVEKLLERQESSPTMPAAMRLQQLREIDPGLVKWVVDQTEFEADLRRIQNTTLNSLAHTERISGLAICGMIAIFGFITSAYVTVQGHYWAALSLCGTTLAIISLILLQMRQPVPALPPASEPKPKRKRPARALRGLRGKLRL